MFGLRRREFITLLSGAAAWPLAARAQQPERMRRIGALSGLPENDEVRARFAALREGLQKFGWSEGRTIHIDYRWASDASKILPYAAELVALNPEIIFAAPSAAVAAVQRATRSVPVVFAQVSDPVGAGFAASLARPGGNITGFAQFEFGLGAKWMELLKQIAPSVERVAVIYDPANSASTGYLPMIDAGARSYGAQVIPTTVHDATEIERAIVAVAREPNGGLIPLPTPLIFAQREQIISLATRHRLPNVYAFRHYPANGGLASYGVDTIELYRSAASYIDRILKGEKPADLPIQLATKFELVINLTTAKALGLEVPPTLLARADEVIE
jgi:putative tryptophan/tyrosine transport system substrate-binding protein